MELMARVSAQGSRTGQTLESGKTLMLSKESLQSMLAD